MTYLVTNITGFASVFTKWAADPGTFAGIPVLPQEMVAGCHPAGIYVHLRAVHGCGDLARNRAALAAGGKRASVQHPNLCAAGDLLHLPPFASKKAA